MIKKLLLPIIMLLVGVGGGVGAAVMLAPAPEPAAEDASPVEQEDAGEDPASVSSEESDPSESEAPEADISVEYLDMSNQFIVPLVSDGMVEGIVVVSISLELVEGALVTVNQLEPKIRDRFLQVLFNHANNGGFSGNFTEFRYLRSLKEELLRNARVIAGTDVRDILILDLVRQTP